MSVMNGRLDRRSIGPSIRLARCLRSQLFYVGSSSSWLTDSHSPARPSQPSRAYLHLTSTDDIQTLSAKVQETKFLDSKGSHSDPALAGPPVVEYSSFNRAPTHKPRKDARQGTIDTDPEYQDFLESLTNPVTKAPPMDTSSDEKNQAEEPKVTPLIQYLRDKKANKVKEPTTPAKVIKSRERKENKETQASEKKIVAKNTKDGPKSDKRGSVKVEKPSRENRKLTTQSTPSSSSKTDSSTTATPASSSSQGSQNSATPAPKPERKRERGSASAAAKILQRDLGLVAGGPGRKKKEAASTASSNATPSSAAKSATPVQPPKPMVVLPPRQPAATTTTVASPTEPVTPTASKPPGKGPNASKGRVPKAKAAAPAAPAAASTATRAFLKHANPSQGITEPLLEEAFTAYGAVTKVEIDKKKGFAYIDFTDNASLQKAIAASPVTVAQGQVVVLECKTGATLQNRNSRAGGNSGNVSGSSNPPTAPAARGGRGGRHHRGGRGGKAGIVPVAASSAVDASSASTTPGVSSDSTAAPASSSTDTTSS